MPKDKHSYKRLAGRPHVKWHVPKEAMEFVKNDGAWLRFFKSWRGWVACVLSVVFLVGLGRVASGADAGLEHTLVTIVVALVLGTLLFAGIHLMNWREPPLVSLYSDALTIDDETILELTDFTAFGFREVSHGFRSYLVLGLIHKDGQWKSGEVPLGKETDAEKVKASLQNAGLTFAENIAEERESTFSAGQYDEMPANKISTRFRKRITGEEIAMVALGGVFLVICVLGLIRGVQEKDAEAFSGSVLIGGVILLALWKTLRVVACRTGEVCLTSEGIVWKKGAKRVEVPYVVIKEAGASGAGLTLWGENRKILLEVPDGLLDHEAFFDEFMKRWQVAVRAKKHEVETAGGTDGRG